MDNVVSAAQKLLSELLAFQLSLSRTFPEREPEMPVFSPKTRQSMSVSFNGIRLHLTPRNVAVFHAIVTSDGDIVTSRKIGERLHISDNNIYVSVNRLRRQLNMVASNLGKSIITCTVQTETGAERQYAYHFDAGLFSFYWERSLRR